MKNLQNILKLHAMFLAGEGGECADLSNANLSNADLRGADFKGATK